MNRYYFYENNKKNVPRYLEQKHSNSLRSIHRLVEKKKKTLRSLFSPSLSIATNNVEQQQTKTKSSAMPDVYKYKREKKPTFKSAIHSKTL